MTAKENLRNRLAPSWNRVDLRLPANTSCAFRHLITAYVVTDALGMALDFIIVQSTRFQRKYWLSQKPYGRPSNAPDLPYARMRITYKDNYTADSFHKDSEMFGFS